MLCIAPDRIMQNTEVKDQNYLSKKIMVLQCKIASYSLSFGPQEPIPSHRTPFYRPIFYIGRYISVV